jgi:hypothetical protein
MLKQISSHQTRFEEHRVLFESPGGAELTFRVFVVYGFDGEPQMFAVQAAEWTDVLTAELARREVEGVPAEWIDDREDAHTVMALAALWKSIRDHREAEVAGLPPQRARRLEDG